MAVYGSHLLGSVQDLTSHSDHWYNIQKYQCITHPYIYIYYIIHQNAQHSLLIPKTTTITH